jgi:hypothetical protein
MMDFYLISSNFDSIPYEYNIIVQVFLVLAAHLLDTGFETF